MAVIAGTQNLTYERIDCLNREVASWILRRFKIFSTEHQKRVILEVPICQHGAKGKVVWPITENGQYSVKSG